jgi:hypothetical protein
MAYCPLIVAFTMLFQLLDVGSVAYISEVRAFSIFIDGPYNPLSLFTWMPPSPRSFKT